LQPIKPESLGEIAKEDPRRRELGRIPLRAGESQRDSPEYRGRRSGILFGDFPEALRLDRLQPYLESYNAFDQESSTAVEAAAVLPGARRPGRCAPEDRGFSGEFAPAVGTGTDQWFICGAILA